MSIDFERNQAQVIYENFLGVTPEIIYDKREVFKSHCLTSNEAYQLKEALKIDAINFFYNGLVSILDGIDSAYNNRFSWATVKLYYSLYYLIRATMASKEIAMIRCRSMYRVLAKAGEKPYSTGNRKYNTTHEGTISHYKDLFDRSDMLLSNSINGEDAYKWLMDVREIVNYRSGHFSEPDHLEIWNRFYESVSDENLVELLKKIFNDPYIMCFQEEYAVIAVPIKRLQQTIADLQNKGLLDGIGEERVCYLNSLVGDEDVRRFLLKQVFSNL